MDNSITTVAGRVVYIVPVSRILTEKIRAATIAEYEARGETLTIPTYFVYTVAGDVQEFPHDKETIKDAPAADVEKWRSYHITQGALSREISARITKFLLLRGIVIDNSEMERALKTHASFHIDIPDNESERIIHYITTEILPTPLDIINATQAIMLLSMSGIEEETLRAVEASFRGALEKAGRFTPAEHKNADKQLV